MASVAGILQNRFIRGALLLATLGTTLGAGAFTAGWTLVCAGGQCPSVDVLELYQPRQTSKLYAADGRFISELGLERRTVARLADIPPLVQNAFVYTEDRRFFSHHGIDFYRVFGSLLVNVVRGGYAQGFSTITMQLARNIFPERLERAKSVVRKMREGKVALAIERKYSKQKILELYLNQIYLGNGAYGVESAAQRYFGKNVRELNLAEASLLAALPKAPNRYNPRVEPDRAVQRRNTVLELLREQHIISDADASLAKAYPLQLAQRTETGDIAPYFVEWVRKQLDEQFGRQLYEQGLKVYTTLDIDMQLAAERAMEQQLRAIEGGRFGAYKFLTYEQHFARAGDDDRAESGITPYLQGAFVALDPRTGGVRAMVGGRDYGDSKFNRATQALRQPGSTFKPLVYADAIQNGHTTAEALEDSPLSVPQSGGGTWSPQNFDGRSMGYIPMRRALYLSRNQATVRLGMSLGEESVAAMARRFGLSTPMPPFPSLHLGAADVYPLEMIAAYTTFAAGGIRARPTGIVRVENAKGEVLWEPKPVRTAVLSTGEAWLMTDMLRDVVRRGTAARAVASLRIPSGGKTGTTNDGADVWFIGFTPDLVAGVWMGLDKPRTIMRNAQGGELAAPAWTAFMNEVYRRRANPGDFAGPGGLVAVPVDRLTGFRAGPLCPADRVYIDYFVAGTEPTQECDGSLPGAPGDGGDSLTNVMTLPGGGTVVTPRVKKPAADTTNPFRLP
ncbi:MAG: PBP1A family penicillin-binding protein [Gemmatimonadaceae bacterium]|nr:PBP1A family penicillin-binding protein [Gemmatimonadaceae bacterium]